MPYEVSWECKLSTNAEAFTGAASREARDGSPVKHCRRILHDALLSLSIAIYRVEKGPVFPAAPATRDEVQPSSAVGLAWRSLVDILNTFLLPKIQPPDQAFSQKKEPTFRKRDRDGPAGAVRENLRIRSGAGVVQWHEQ